MDAKRLEFRRKLAEELNSDADRELLKHIDQQQAEIDRLNRAYEVLEDALNRAYMKGYGEVAIIADNALEEARRIKNGKDGEQG